MNEEYLIDLVGRQRLEEIEQVPVRLHFLETRDMLEGYLTRFKNRLWSLRYDLEYVRTYLLILEAGSNSPKKMSYYIKKVDALKDKPMSLRVRVREMKAKELEKLFKLCRDYVFKQELGNPKSDKLISSLYRADLMSADGAFRCLEVVEELIAECLVDFTARYTYERVNGEVKIVECANRGPSRHTVYLGLDDKLTLAGSMLDDSKIERRMILHDKAIRHYLDSRYIVDRAFNRAKCIEMGW